MTAVIRLRNFILNRLYSAHFYLVLYNFVARLYGVQEAVSSTLATRTKDGCQKQQKPSPHGLGFFVYIDLLQQ